MSASLAVRSALEPVTSSGREFQPGLVGVERSLIDPAAADCRDLRTFPRVVR